MELDKMFVKCTRISTVILWLFILTVLNVCYCTDNIYFSDVKKVTNGTRYTTANPEVELRLLQKVRHREGNIAFMDGQEISGHTLVATKTQTKQFTKSEDVELILRYPAEGKDGAVITLVQIFSKISAEGDASAAFSDGGIHSNYAEIVISVNRTLSFDCEVVIFGYGKALN